MGGPSVPNTLALGPQCDPPDTTAGTKGAGGLPLHVSPGSPPCTTPSLGCPLVSFSPHHPIPCLGPTHSPRKDCHHVLWMRGAAQRGLVVCPGPHSCLPGARGGHNIVTPASELFPDPRAPCSDPSGTQAAGTEAGRAPQPEYLPFLSPFPRLPEEDQQGPDLDCGGLEGGKFVASDCASPRPWVCAKGAK